MIFFFLSVTTILLAFYAGKVSNNYRVNKGERRVAQSIQSVIDSDNEVLVNNVTLELDDGHTTQIDHILISRHGVYVIETKHYSGWIFGDENTRNWTQVIYKKKTKFQNPIRQNYKHLQTVRQLFDFLPENDVHSLIVFSGDAKFKTPLPKNVFYKSGLEKFLAEQKEYRISLNRVQFCLGRLQFIRLPENSHTDKLHVANLKSNVVRIKH